MFNLAGDIFAFDHVADAHFFPQHDQHACQEILEDVLEGKTNRHGSDTESGKQAGRREIGDDHHRRDEDAEGPDSEPDERIDKVLKAAAYLGAPNDGVGNAHGKSRNDPRHKDDEECNRKAGQRLYEAFAHGLQLRAQRCDIIHVAENSLCEATGGLHKGFRIAGYVLLKV